ncbi:outer membrane protein assembly factor BamB [Aquimonas voraii]|uniref:Outer membrane protein assembly factor BamB n=1 Tax=Aquimonas voraii TaxID=265719 RepID=A0A1G6V2C8_9GAMM|nr:outer membrane protein assembly factor BamB [Aquimonas voraii]SDD47760.1 Beta-barrel assembly machine subunit BamB [Aquimonas voraii]
MRGAVRALGLSLLALGLVACSGSRVSKRENIEPPAELVDFESNIRIERAWSRSMGEGEGSMGLRQRPVAGEGKLYFGNVEGEVTALDVQTGRELWSQEFEGLRFAGPPGFGEGTLLMTTLDGVVLALNPDTGAERWRADVTSEVIAQPTIGRGLAVVRANDGRLFAFSITDGTRRWVFDRALPSLTLRGNSPPLIVDTALFVGYDDGSVVALRVENGSPVWEQPVSVGEGRTDLDRMSDVDGEIAFRDGLLFAGSYRGQVVAFEALNARPLWNREMSVYGGVVLAGEAVLVADDRGNLWSLDQRTGSAIWKQDALAHRWLTTPAYHAGYAAAGDIEGYVHWMSMEDGRFLGRARHGKKPLRGSPIVVDDLLIVTSTDGEIAAFRVR